MNIEVETACVLDNDCPIGEFDRLAAKLEVDVMHRHLAVEEVEHSGHVLHSQLHGTTGVDTRLRRPGKLEADV